MNSRNRFAHMCSPMFFRNSPARRGPEGTLKLGPAYAGSLIANPSEASFRIGYLWQDVSKRLAKRLGYAAPPQKKKTQRHSPRRPRLKLSEDIMPTSSLRRHGRLLAGIPFCHAASHKLCSIRFEHQILNWSAVVVISTTLL